MLLGAEHGHRFVRILGHGADLVPLLTFRSSLSWRQWRYATVEMALEFERRRGILQPVFMALPIYGIGTAAPRRDKHKKYRECRSDPSGCHQPF